MLSISKKNTQKYSEILKIVGKLQQNEKKGIIWKRNLVKIIKII